MHELSEARLDARTFMWPSTRRQTHAEDCVCLGHSSLYTRVQLREPRALVQTEHRMEQLYSRHELRLVRVHLRTLASRLLHSRPEHTVIAPCFNRDAMIAESPTAVHVERRRRVADDDTSTVQQAARAAAAVDARRAADRRRESRVDAERGRRVRPHVRLEQLARLVGR